MRKGMTGLAMLVQQGLCADPFDGAVFAFRGRCTGLIKLIWHDGIGLCMPTKRSDRAVSAPGGRPARRLQVARAGAGATAGLAG
jgi:transposase